MSKNNSYILCKTGFEPEIVLSSVRTVIEEQNNSLPAAWHGLPAGMAGTQKTQIQQINTEKKNSENPPASHGWLTGRASQLKDE